VKIIDLSAGNRAVWFNKRHPECLYVDMRKDVEPDLLADTKNLPLSAGAGFDLVVFDPPHMNFGKKSNMARVYGHFTQREIIETIQGTSKEAQRISRPEALMAFKWNDHDVRLLDILKLMPEWEPLFGHLTKDGPGSKTYWVMLKRRNPC
jgi:hypothetical protein